MKRAQGLPIQLIIIALIVMVTALVVIFGFKGIWGKSINNVKDTQDKTSDKDSDGVIDLFDQCPCANGIREYEGCSKDLAKIQDKNEVARLKKAGC